MALDLPAVCHVHFCWLVELPKLVVALLLIKPLLLYLPYHHPDTDMAKEPACARDITNRHPTTPPRSHHEHALCWISRATRAVYRCCTFITIPPPPSADGYHSSPVTALPTLATTAGTFLLYPHRVYQIYPPVTFGDERAASCLHPNITTTSGVYVPLPPTIAKPACPGIPPFCPPYSTTYGVHAGPYRPSTLLEWWGSVQYWEGWLRHAGPCSAGCFVCNDCTFLLGAISPEL